MNNETAQIALEIDNDEHELDEAIGIARDRIEAYAAKPDREDAEFQTRIGVEDALREYVSQRMEDFEQDAIGDQTPFPGLYMGLANAALCRVEWRALAEHYIGKAREQAKFEASVS